VTFGYRRLALSYVRLGPTHAPTLDLVCQYREHYVGKTLTISVNANASSTFKVVVPDGFQSLYGDGSGKAISTITEFAGLM